MTFQEIQDEIRKASAEVKAKRQEYEDAYVRLKTLELRRQVGRINGRIREGSSVKLKYRKRYYNVVSAALLDNYTYDSVQDMKISVTYIKDGVETTASVYYFHVYMFDPDEPNDIQI